MVSYGEIECSNTSAKCRNHNSPIISVDSICLHCYLRARFIFSHFISPRAEAFRNYWQVD